MMKTKLARAVALAAAGISLSLGAPSIASATSTTMYNTDYTGGLGGGTDGWVYGYRNANYPTVTGFIGINGTNAVTQNTPFNYAGSAYLNWAAYLDTVGDSATISAADAAARYQLVNNGTVNVEIDTGAGAWQDAGGTTGTIQGWAHQTDIGLFKTGHDMYVTLKPNVVSGSGYDIQNFGITVFTGMDTTSGLFYGHHAKWNTIDKPPTTSNPFGTQNVEYLTHDSTVDAINGLTFLANAGQVYSIYLGGAGVGQWGQNLADYSLAISSAPVPVPAATWLFGGALMSLFGAHRRKSVLRT